MAPPSFASNVIVAVVEAVVPEGPEVIVTLMAGLAPAHASGNAISRAPMTTRSRIRGIPSPYLTLTFFDLAAAQLPKSRIVLAPAFA